MKKLIIIGITLFTSIFYYGCKKTSDKEATNLSNESKESSLVIPLKGNEYFKKTTNYFLGKSWLTFKDQSVEFMICSLDGWGNTINKRNIMGKYKVTGNTIEIDFGRESVNIEYLTGGFNPIRKDVDYPLPSILSFSINNGKVIIDDWRLLEPEPTKPVVVEKVDTKDDIKVNNTDIEDNTNISNDVENREVTAIKDKVYFYKDFDYETKTTSYFVKGQKAEYTELNDDNFSGDFIHVKFEHNGKVTTGYVLKNDVDFE
ncbi:hypothetical protein [Flavobacterium sp. CAU 1735]|uniref:hypothetical protein n=1 Tax=Flavobacterium sp. CAU 1735 TaxID=3140361 RepID=UPI003260E35B